jgi:Flp pilus assembly protein TadB
MPTHPENPRLDYRGKRSGPGAQSLLTKVLGVVIGAALLIGTVAISFVLFVVALAGLLVVGVYVWWKTRDLRRELKFRSQGGDVIEGEVIRDVPQDNTKH